MAGSFRSGPNPADRATTVRYELSRACPVSVRMHDATGRVVAELVNATQNAGEHSVSWNASDTPSGIYYCTLQTGGEVTTRPLVVNH